MMKKRAGQAAEHRGFQDARARVANEAATVVVAAGRGAEVSGTSARSPAGADAARQEVIEPLRSQFYWGPP